MKILGIRTAKGTFKYWDGYGFSSNPADAISWSLVEFYKEHIDKMKKVAEKAGLNPKETYICEFTGIEVVSTHHEDL